MLTKFHTVNEIWLQLIDEFFYVFMLAMMPVLHATYIVTWATALEHGTCT